MVSSSKILTVSYGTFSCTVEGFEDPLTVVKDTTQFFRGVVKEDRFFGAEPPQFDAELAAEMMRAQIAAEESDGRLMLRPATTGASSGALVAALSAGPARAASPVPETPGLPDDAQLEEAARLAAEAQQAEQEEAARLAAEAQAAAEAEAQAEKAASIASDTFSGATAPPEIIEPEQQAEPPAMVAEAAPAPSASATPASPPESIASRLERIRNVVAEPASETISDDDGAPAADADSASFEDGEDIPAFDSDTLSAMLSDHAGDTAEGDTADDAVARTAAILPAETEAEQDDAWASLTATPSLDETAYEDEALDDILPRAEAPELDIAAFVADSIAADTGEEAELAPLAAPMDEDDTDDSSLESLADLVAAQQDTDDADAEPESAAETDWDAEGAQDEIPEPEALANAEAPLPEPEAAVAEPEPAPEPAARPALRARVVKVKRAVFDKAVAQGQLEEVEDDADDAALSPEEEDELARELEAVKAELSGDLDDWEEDHEAVAEPDQSWDDDSWQEEPAAASAPGPAPLRLDASVHPDWEDDAEPAAAQVPEPDMQAAHDDVRKAVKMASPARALLTEKTVEEDDASRLLDQTNTELEEPEGNRRRSAIAHLRAAVAATRADRLLGRKPDTTDEKEAYREDLATVVRPRRPQAATRSERPAPAPEARPAPLKLVAEQRVSDTPEPEAAAPVRPRRVSVTDEPMPESVDGGFADYADSVGARDLPELLEAAAAYMSFVEGRDQFSRPQLMTTVRQAEQEDFSREDRLRSFGRLLREGKIERTKGGRFTASERISFKPSRRAG